MNTQAQNTAGHMVQISWIPKYTFIERFLHWVHTVSFIPLVATGLVLYLPSLQALAQGDAGIWMRLVHRLAAVLFIAEPVLYGIVQPLRLWLNIKDFGFDRDALGWIKNAFGYYVLGKHADMPPQGRYNTGEKINGVVMILSWVLLQNSGEMLTKQGRSRNSNGFC